MSTIVDLRPAELDVKASQGLPVTLTITYKDSAGSAINLSGYTAQMSFKSTPSASATVTLATGGSGITLGSGTGNIVIALSAANSALLTAGVWYYDFKLIDGSSVPTKPFGGMWEAVTGVTAVA